VPVSLGSYAPRWLALSACTALLAACDSQPLNEPSATPSTMIEEEPLELKVLDEVHISSNTDAEYFQRAAADVDFGEETVTRATLRVALRSPCFPFEGWAELTIPEGQRWPEPCDAFDRTLSVTLDEELELLRGVTPFGGPLELEADVTNLVNGLPGKHELSLRIDTWSDADGLVSGAKGEWIASASVTLVHGPAPRRVLAVVPLELGAQTEPDSAAVTFSVPRHLGSARIEYRATGHGAVFSPGCAGPGEEFCQRAHQLYLDDELLSELSPWRDDCAELCTITTNQSSLGPSSYCAENPCGDPRSVRASRANWCPGSVTPPFVIESGALLRPGLHSFSRKVPELATGGTWTISAVFFGFE
jgi:hypothetical protein